MADVLRLRPKKSFEKHNYASSVASNVSYIQTIGTLHGLALGDTKTSIH